eukprot:Blabericola_migrator_1__2092@NODE_1578_length_4247_cov_155_379665_g1031_i0_p1_GENE_NODE_1578_length_4247_cov_155_379665_g1031_i0NODE_1578_length_4247_cov_155_379665_g1031_i0_p1_ORF_typecomplete_len468_score55_38_NODE_1578_length_4247_cov_155_379665_g1031_i012562659
MAFNVLRRQHTINEIVQWKKKFDLQMRCLIASRKDKSLALKSLAVCIIAIIPEEVTHDAWLVDVPDASSTPSQYDRSNIIREAFRTAMGTGEDSSDDWFVRTPSVDQDLDLQQALDSRFLTAEMDCSQIPYIQTKRKADYLPDEQIIDAHKRQRRSGGIAESGDAQEDHPTTPLGSNVAEYVGPLVSSSQDASDSQGVINAQMRPCIGNDVEDKDSAFFMTAFGTSAGVSQDNLDGTVPYLSAVHIDLLRKYQAFSYPYSQVPDYFKKLVEDYSSVLIEDPIMIKVVNLIYLRFHEPHTLQRESLKYCEDEVRKIKRATTDASVSLMCDWLILMTKTPYGKNFFDYARQHLNQDSAKSFLKIGTMLYRSLETYPGLDKALILEWSRKKSLKARKVYRKMDRKWIIVTSLPLIFQRPEAEPFLAMVENMKQRFAGRDLDWVLKQQECLLSLLATAGHIAQFATVPNKS